MKNKYKKQKEATAEQNENMLEALHDFKEDDELCLKSKENKTAMYSDNIRQLYMALQGEANVAGTQASKVVMLVAKYLFKQTISLKELPCPKTCLNFMNEANHIAKQQIVENIIRSEHFTYATDGTTRQKNPHFLEHHIVLNNGSMLSVGYSEIVDDKAETLLDKNVDLFDELADVYTQANDDCNKSEVFVEIMTKMQTLMSDRAANMKASNHKMAEYKKSIVGQDAVVHFLYCNAHFLIGLAEETDKAIKITENNIIVALNHKLGRDLQPMFSNFKRDESRVYRLIRTCADVLGPRGDEKKGCREEWLANCVSTAKKSMFTSHRSNRFNNTFENPVALLYHHKDALHFLTYKVTNSIKKLLSIIYDLEDKHIVSILAAVALLAVHLTSPYWKLMISRTPSYGQFSKHVQSMKSALQRWSSEDFDISNLQHESPVFGLEFQTSVEIPTNFLQTDFFLKDVTSNAFRQICQRCLIVTDRQLADFLPGAVYGDTLPDDLQQLLDRCPLTNLIGERMFGDLDYNMNKRTALTHTRSSLNMCKHNRLSSYLDKLSPSLRKKTMASGRKHGKSLKRKHCEAVKAEGAEEVED